MSRPRISQSFVGATAIWWAILVFLGFLFHATTISPPDRGEGVLWSLPGFMGQFLPFAGFAGGIAIQRTQRAGPVLLRATLFAVVVYGLYAILNPIVDYRELQRAGVNLEERFPFGPETPLARVDLRREVEANPPGEYGFSVSQPRAVPPNWLTYLIHEPVAFALFGFFVVLLGVLAGQLSSGLSPPSRRNARWAIGLFVGASFLVVALLPPDWVRADLANSGLLAAYLPLTVPMTELGILWILVRGKRARMHDRDPPDVS